MSSGWIFKVQRHCIHDGPGIRTTVFFKGCPLSCLWCFNPESQNPEPEVVHSPGSCIACGLCVKECPQPGTLGINQGKIIHNKHLCTDCGICTEVCPAGALGFVGYQISAEEIAATALRDKVFYEKSGGGVTLSGGEATTQPEFARDILRLCREEGIHTAIETCGHSPWEDLERILEFTDIVLFDLKVVNSRRHRELTGVSNELILANMQRVSQSGKEMVLRIPVIPGLNDSEEDLVDSIAIIKSLPVCPGVHLLPYELLGVEKYRRLGRDYRLEGVQLHSEGELEQLRLYFIERGIDVQIGG